MLTSLPAPVSEQKCLPWKVILRSVLQTGPRTAIANDSMSNTYRVKVQCSKGAWNDIHDHKYNMTELTI